MITKPLSKKEIKKLMTDIGGRWYMEKITKGIPPLRRPNLSKKSQEKEDEKKYMNIIGVGIIGDSNYIGASLSGSIQEVKSRVNNLIQFLKFC